MGAGNSTRWCASDRLVVVRSIVDLGGVGVAASSTHGGAGARPQPGHRGARHASARLIGRRIQRGCCLVVPVAAWGGRSQERKNPNTSERLPLTSRSSRLGPRVIRARASRLSGSVSEPRRSKSLKDMGSDHSTRWCASDRLVVVRSLVDLGGVGVAASGTHGGAGARPQPGHRGARHSSARVDRWADPAAVGSGGAGGGLWWAVPRTEKPEHQRTTSANIPLEPTRPARDSCPGLTAQRWR